MYFSLFVFLGLNIYVLREYSTIKEKYKEEVNGGWLNEYRANSYKISNRLMTNNEFLENKIPDTVRTRIRNKNLVYLVYTTNEDCSNCILDTLNEIGSIDKAMNKRIVLFYEKTSNTGINFSSFFDANKLDYSKYSLSFTEEFIVNEINQFPLFILYSPKENDVLEVFQPEPNNYEFLEAFIKRVRFHLES